MEDAGRPTDFPPAPCSSDARDRVRPFVRAGLVLVLATVLGCGLKTNLVPLHPEAESKKAKPAATAQEPPPAGEATPEEPDAERDDDTGDDDTEAE